MKLQGDYLAAEVKHEFPLCAVTASFCTHARSQQEWQEEVNTFCSTHIELLHVRIPLGTRWISLYYCINSSLCMNFMCSVTQLQNYWNDCVAEPQSSTLCRPEIQCQISFVSLHDSKLLHQLTFSDEASLHLNHTRTRTEQQTLQCRKSTLYRWNSTCKSHSFVHPECKKGTCPYVLCRNN
jgi:hypothetical protein